MLNATVFHRALGAAHAGHVDHGEWTAPDASESNSMLKSGGDYKYPIIGADGRVNAKGVSSALGYAKTNGESEIIGPLQKIDAAIKGDDTKTLSRALETIGAMADRLYDLDPADADALDLSRAPRLAKCPSGLCGSYDVDRMPGGEHEGPTDRCRQCGRQWSHKPGTVTAEQFGNSENLSEKDIDPADVDGEWSGGRPGFLESAAARGIS
jgi:hypothetical protein